LSLTWNANSEQAPVPTPETETQQDVVAESQDQGKSAEESGAVSDPNADQDQANGSNAMLGNNAIFNMNGMPGQMGFGFPNQGNFNGMGFNGMNVMPGMMGNGNWNSMNPMGMSTRSAFLLSIADKQCTQTSKICTCPEWPTACTTALEETWA
jgi:hypothetical protein